MRIRRSGLVACRDMNDSLVSVRAGAGTCVGTTVRGQKCSRWAAGASSLPRPLWSWSGVLSGDPLLEQDGGDDDRALGNGLVRCVQVVQGEDVGECREDEHSQHGADDRAPATAE